jgi:signal transduction histidine kinase
MDGKINIFRKNIFLYGLTFLILTLGLSVLIYLERRIVRDRQAAIDNARDLLGKETILKARDDIRISFSRIESLAQTIQKNPFIREIYVSKLLNDNRERILYPFYWETLPQNKKAKLPLLKKIPLFSDNNEILGYLYINLNNRILLGVRGAVALFAFFLILTLVSYLSRVRSQERIITETTVELEEKRKELIRLERLALAGQLTANILHDIKKPVLNIKQEALELMDNTPDVEIKQTALGILQQVDLFFNILRDLGLERFVKAREEGEEYVDINDMLNRSCSLVRYEQGSIEVKKEYETNPPLLLAHPYKIIQVFSNLILNAFQAMKGKGALVLRTRRQKNEIRVEIADKGPGIPPDMIPKMFTPFFTTRDKGGIEEQGTGLGLYISKNIIDDLKGKIHVQSSPDEGTTFYITLPLVEKVKKNID